MRGIARVGVGVGAGLLAALLLAAGVLETVEWKTWDWRVRHFAPSETSGQVAVIAVDQASLDYAESEHGLTWPWPRGLYVPIVEYCRAAGARGVVFDVFFTEFSSYGVGDDEEFAGSLSGGGTVLAMGVHAGDQGSSVWPGTPLPVTGDAAALAHPFQTLTLPVEPLAHAAAALGNVNSSPDDDGIFRRMPVVFANDDAQVLALPWAAAALFGVKLEAKGPKLTANGKNVPLDAHHSMVIPYRGPAGTIPSYSAASAIQSFIRLDTGEPPSLDPEALRDRVVFVGLTAPGLLDLRPTPISAVFPGVEVQATVLDAVLAGSYVSVTPRLLASAQCLLVALLMTVALTLFRGAWTSTLSLPMVLSLPVVGGALAAGAGIWTPVAGPVVAGALAFLSVRTLDYATEGRQKRFLKQAFRHYLSPEVVEQLVQDPSRLRLGGERKELSIFFSDLESFTTLSEKLPPDKLTAMLNRYLSAMTNVIQHTGGTVDKYVGDAIVAFWNAPLDQPDHARRALTAAVRCLERLEAINPELEKLTGFPLRMRIGIHTGTVLVGNLGSEERFDYSILGDAANLASRLEGLGKVFKSPVIVSEAAWTAADGAATGREIGRVRVVGREAPVTIFQPTGLAAEPPLFAWARVSQEPFERALHAYYAGDLETAAAAFRAIADDPVAVAYVAQCERLQASGLPQPWHGVWEMTGK